MMINEIDLQKRRAGELAGWAPSSAARFNLETRPGRRLARNRHYRVGARQLAAARGAIDLGPATRRRSVCGAPTRLAVFAGPAGAARCRRPSSPATRDGPIISPRGAPPPLGLVGPASNCDRRASSERRRSIGAAECAAGACAH
jgi:hypothetical protein